MLETIKNSLFGDFLNNFDKSKGEKLETEDPELIQLQYHLRWWV
jgi:hypothetical protein